MLIFLEECLDDARAQHPLVPTAKFESMQIEYLVIVKFFQGMNISETYKAKKMMAAEIMVAKKAVIAADTEQ